MIQLTTAGRNREYYHQCNANFAQLCDKSLLIGEDDTIEEFVGKVKYNFSLLNMHCSIDPYMNINGMLRVINYCFSLYRYMADNNELAYGEQTEPTIEDNAE